MCKFAFLIRLRALRAFFFERAAGFIIFTRKVGIFTRQIIFRRRRRRRHAMMMNFMNYKEAFRGHLTIT